MSKRINTTSRRKAIKQLACAAGITLLPINAMAKDKKAAPADPKNIPGLPKQLFDNTPLVPTKVFDNIYCIGSFSVVAWLIKTSEGFIMIDSMWDNRDAQLIVDGMHKLGLDPADIKKIMLTHGHGDHYGGAQYIKDKYHAEILMGETDERFMQELNTGPNGPRSPKCTVDSHFSDGDKIQLGDTTVTAVETPGHTPGCFSFIYPARQGDKTFMVGQWGGSGLPRDLEAKEQYRASIDHFEKYTRELHVDVCVTAHLFTENGYAKLDAARKGQNAENPFYVGEAGYSEYLNRVRNNVDKAIAKQKG